MANAQDAYYLSLLALAERFRAEEPKNIKATVQCLQAVLTFRPPPRVEARTHLQLGNILTHYTKNTKLALTHFEQAWNLSMNIVGFDDVRFEAAGELAKLHHSMGDAASAKALLRKANDLSQQTIFWHCQLLFISAQISVTEKDYQTAFMLLQSGIEYTHMHGVKYTHLLFMLSKLMIMMIYRSPHQEVQSLLSQSSQMVEVYNGAQGQKEHLRVFLLVLLVSNHLKNGQVKSGKTALKLLQQAIQNVSELSEEDLAPDSSPELFVWLPREQLCILAFFVSVLHSVQAGHMEKAQKYTDKALQQIEKLRQMESYSNSSMLDSLELFLNEHSAICHLVIGTKESAIKEIAKVMKALKKNYSLLPSHRGQLHTALGIYAMSMNDFQHAEIQLRAALQHSHHELWIFINLNLAIVYLRTNKQNEFNAVIAQVSPEQMSDQDYSLKAAGYYVKGLHAFFTNKHDEGKRYLRESLKMANSEDLNRLTSCSLVLLGHIFLSLGSPREASNMVSPAMQLASKIPDLHLQLWASAILKDLHRQFGDVANEQECTRNHFNFSQTLMKDHSVASRCPEHNLVSWVDGPFPDFLDSL